MELVEKLEYLAKNPLVDPTTVTKQFSTKLKGFYDASDSLSVRNKLLNMKGKPRNEVVPFPDMTHGIAS